jgi:hypothetical protein
MTQGMPGPYPEQPDGDPQYPPQMPYAYPPGAMPWPQPYAYPAPPRRRSQPVIGWLLFPSAVLVIVAAVLPWATAFGLSISGTSGDGQITLACGLILAGLALLIGLGEGRLWVSITSIAISVVLLVVGLIDALDMSRIVTEYGGVASVGSGLWLTVVGGLFALALSITAAVHRPAI